MANPPHKPTKESRDKVELLSGLGITQVEIAAIIGIDAKTLKKHYPDEFLAGKAKANSRVAKALFRKAVDSGDTTAMIFWMKTQARWSERVIHEIELPEIIPIKIPKSDKDDE